MNRWLNTAAAAKENKPLATAQPQQQRPISTAKSLLSSLSGKKRGENNPTNPFSLGSQQPPPKKQHDGLKKAAMMTAMAISASIQIGQPALKPRILESFDTDATQSSSSNKNNNPPLTLDTTASSSQEVKSKIEDVPEAANFSVPDAVYENLMVPGENEVHLLSDLEAYDLEEMIDEKSSQNADEISEWDVDFKTEVVQLRQQKMSLFVSKPPKHNHAPTAQFQCDPRKYSSVLFNTYNSRQSAALEIAKKSYSAMGVLPTILSRVQYSEGDVKPRTPVMTIRFDKHGALFAVGSSNGIVRVYDFDHCLLHMQQCQSLTFASRRKAGFHPIVSVDTRRAVSDIAWSLENEDEICVSFSFRSEIFVYDLQDLSSPLATLRIGATTGTNGHSCVIYVAALTGRSSDRSHEQCVLAGGKSGHIRKWNIRSNPNSAIWQVNADAFGNGSPVVSLIEIEQQQRLVSLTQSGCVAMWDLEHMVVPTFGSASVPTLLQRLNLGITAVGLTFSPTYICEISSAKSTDDDVQSKNVATKNRLNVNGELFVTTSRGKIMTVALDNTQQLSMIHSNRAEIDISIEDDRRTKIVGVNQDPEDILALEGAHVCPHPCPAQLSFLGNQVLCCPVVDMKSGLSTIVVLSSQEAQSVAMRNPFPEKQLSSADFAYGGAAAMHRSSAAKLVKVYGPVKIADGKAEPEYCLTLPGKVVSAEHGSTEIIVSHALDQYLAVASTAASNPSRSHNIYLDWSQAACVMNAKPKNRTAALLGTAYTLLHVQPHVITLSEPYQGPSVEHGQPRVVVRTNLAPRAVERYSGGSTWLPSCGRRTGGRVIALTKLRHAIKATNREIAGNAIGVAGAGQVAGSAANNAVTETGHVEAAAQSSEAFVPLPPLTAMSCHPMLPFIITGHADDTVNVVGMK